MKKTIHSEAQKSFSSLLRAARERKRLTQTDLANRLGRPQSFVAKVERGERRLDVIEFEQVADALGIPAIPFLRKLYGHKGNAE